MNQDIKHIVVSSAAAETIAMVQNEATRELNMSNCFLTKDMKRNKRNKKIMFNWEDFYDQNYEKATESLYESGDLVMVNVIVKIV